MIKKPLGIIGILFLSMNVNALDINIASGWQLKGTYDTLNIDTLNKSCVDSIWSYDSSNQQWKAYFTDADMQQIAGKYYDVSILTTINPTDGFWVYGNDNCILNTATPSDNNFTYSTITSEVTGKVWMDRNLGASRACISFDDEQCYGDYYQWGRNADGHEKKNSSTTSTQATSTSNVGHGKFITSSSSYNYDWAKDVDSDGTIRSANWNPCPTGYRIPTIKELKAENISDRNDAYSKLKLPSAGGRDYPSGYLGDQGSYGYYWSSSVDGSNSETFNFSSSSGDSYSPYRAYGSSVRCLKEE